MKRDTAIRFLRAVVRWLAQLIVDDDLHPATGGHLIWVRRWNELGHPDALQPSSH